MNFLDKGGLALMQRASRAATRGLRQKIGYVFLVLLTFAVTFILYQQYAYLLGRKTTEFAYWNLLAKAFMEGKLYLTNPPTTWDLTFYQGHWFIPPPPLPAILMLPLVFLGGEVNTVLFSIFFSAINSMLLLMILTRLSRLGWIKIAKAGILWLVALFALGTPHWWVGMDGRYWYVSQIVTVTFVALAVLLALDSRSPWLVGLCLGMAIWSRPNVIVTWPFLFAIAMQLLKDRDKKIQPRPLVNWAIKSIIPIVLSVLGLLFYNYLRFHDFLDFGYATINGDTNLVEAIHKYGMFGVHYIPKNLYVMFLKLPDILHDKPYLAPSINGISLFVTTPAFLYLIRKYEKKPWIIGAWVSVILSLILLAMYHNTGTAQFGYRYILDLIVPLVMLMAVTIKDKIPWTLLILILLSIVINEYGAYWFIKYLNG